MERINVSLRERSYFIKISTGLFSDPSSFFPLKSGERAMLVTNDTLAPLYLDTILHTLKKCGVKVDSTILPDGEQHKNLVVLNIIFTELLKKLHGRDTTLIALGGGVIGDLTGFAAANYQRGVRFIQIPTTLLSFVDASIGGKTSINHPIGKNMIGAFYQPSSVLIDLNCLETLPARELISGLAEVVKYGIILDGEFFFWLEENMDALLSLNRETVMYCVRRCCELKAHIVSKDEREINLRYSLNLGHTYGHAIEALVGYGNWRHGEAVSAGIVMAARTSEKLGWFNGEETQRIIKLFKRVGLPVIGPHSIPAQAYIPYMMRDKKILRGKGLCLVLPIEIGNSKVFFGVPRDVVISVLSEYERG